VTGRGEALAIALLVTMAASAIPGWNVVTSLWHRDVLGAGSLPWPVLRSVTLLMLGLLLTMPTRERSGLRVGEIRAHWRGVLVVCGLPVLATALVYPNLPVRPFHGAYATMWLVSPLAQELVFSGFVYGLLAPHCSRYVHRRVPVQWALVLSTLLFGLWHAPGLLHGSSPGYVWFQLFYTGVLGIVPGLSRQWTGSILYVTLAHSAVNLIAWASS
jgi:membrane protease YdiL (CAAX protease family)